MFSILVVPALYSESRRRHAIEPRQEKAFAIYLADHGQFKKLSTSSLKGTLYGNAFGGLASSLLVTVNWFSAKQNRIGFGELERLHHVLCRGFVFFEMRSLQVRFVGGLIGIRFKNPDLVWLAPH